jgi:5-dehydro-2-deoxygluconokinase
VPDWQISLDDLDVAEVSRAPVLFATGTGLAQSPSRETTLALLRAHEGTSVFDLDWRPTLWDDRRSFEPLAHEAAASADVLVGNEEEVDAAGGLDALLALRPTAVVVKRGADGATLYENGDRTDVPGTRVEVVNGLGAGDAFAAALGYAVVRGLGLAEGVRLGNIAGGIVASQLACSEAMPKLDELQAALV